MRLWFVGFGLCVVSCDRGASSAVQQPSAQPRSAAAPVRSSPKLPSSAAAQRRPEQKRPCPGEMALIANEFCIDRWEASTQTPDGGAHSPYHSVAHKSVAAVSQPGVHPQAFISAGEADAACKRSKKRLCTTKQWVTACSGGIGRQRKRVYPHGSRKKPAACNTRRPEHPSTLVFGKHRTDSVSLNNPRLNQVPDTLAKTGEFADCTSPEGVFRPSRQSSRVDS